MTIPVEGDLVIPAPTRVITVADLAGEWRHHEGESGGDSFVFTESWTITQDGQITSGFFGIRYGSKISEQSSGTVALADRVLAVNMGNPMSFVLRGWLELPESTIMNLTGPWYEDPIPKEFFTNPDLGWNLDKRWVRKQPAGIRAATDSIPAIQAPPEAPVSASDQTAEIRSRVAAALIHEERTAALRNHIAQAIAAPGSALDVGQLDQLVLLARTYVEQVPVIMDALRAAALRAAAEPQAADDLRSFVTFLEESFLSSQAISDSTGLGGLLDNAYIVYQLLTLADLEQIAPDVMQAHQFVRRLFAPELADRLDQIASTAIQAASSRSQELAIPEARESTQTAPESPEASLPAAVDSADDGASNVTWAAQAAARLDQERAEQFQSAQRNEQARASSVRSVARREQARADSRTEETSPTGGRLDPSFNGQGAAITAFGGELAEARALCVQPDGRIILAGSVGATSDGPKNFALVRYNSDGTLDETFGTRGKSVVHITGSDSRAYALAVTPDATKIVVVGSSLDLESDKLDFLLVRLTADGLLDKTFNGDGVVFTDFLGHGDDIAYAVAIQGDGRILAAGFTTQLDRARYDREIDFQDHDANRKRMNLARGEVNPADEAIKARSRTKHFGVARYLPDGSLDRDFGDKGLVVTSFPSGLSRAQAICIQPTGEIIVAGGVRTGRDSLADFAAVRYSSDGRLDEAFGVDGRVLIDRAGTADTAHAVILQADGKIVLAGEAADDTDRLHFLLVRLDPSGNLDLDFNGSGVVLLDDLTGAAFGIAVQGDGKLLAGGYATRDATDDAGNLAPKDVFAITRFETDGALDMSFGTSGVARIDLGGSRDRAAAIALQTDGAILAAGSKGLPGEMNFAVIRLTGSPTQ